MAKKTLNFEHNPGMKLFVNFLLLLAVNALGISFTANMFPESIVLGTSSIARNWAILHSMSALALINVFVIPFVKEWELKKRKKLSNKGWMFLYLEVNFVGLWIISRYAEQFGLGITSWVTVLGLAFFLDVIQGLVIMAYEKKIS